MSDSTHDAAGENRPKRDQGARRDSGGARSGAPKRDGDRRPDGQRGSSTGSGRDGDRKPYSGGGRDGDRKPYSGGGRGGARPAYGGGSRESERTSYGRPQRDGDRPSSGRPARGGERPSYGASRDGDRKPYSGGARGGDRPAYGGGARDGERKSAGRPQRDGDRPSYGAPRGGERKPYAGSRGGERPSYGGGSRDGERTYGRPQREGDRPASGRPARGGERPSYGGGSRDGERKQYGRPQRDGDRPSYGGAPRDGERKSYGRPQRDGDRPSYGGAARSGDRTPHQGASRPDDRRSGARVAGRPAERGHGEDAQRPGMHGASELQVRPRHDDPVIPDRIEPRDLDRSARAELKTLTKENADWVARYLVAASEALEDDPELAHRYALSASRRAGRIAVVRETLAITAYATGDFALALREFRTYRRISGSNDQLPLMVDSERGVGRPDRALELGRSVDRATLPTAVQVGLAIAMSGARLDLNQPELALAELEIPQLDPDRAFSYSPALFSAYAEVLDELGRTAEAEEWQARALRAEAALGPDADDVVEVFELEDEGADAAPAASASVDPDERAIPDDATATAPVVEAAAEATSVAASAGADEAAGDAQAPDGSEDPGAVLEPEVAAILAETATPEGDRRADESAE